MITLQKIYLGKNINLKNFGEKICICFFKRKRSLYKDFTLDKDMKCKEFEILSKLNKVLLKYLFYSEITDRMICKQVKVSIAKISIAIKFLQHVTITILSLYCEISK